MTSLLPIGLLTAASWVGTLNAPVLARRQPLLLMALSTRLPFLALAAVSVPAPAFFLVGLARMVAADPCHYLLGKHGARRLRARAGQRAEGAGRHARRVQDAVRSGGVLLVAVRPTGQVLFGAGAAGLRPGAVAVADVAGTTGYLAAVWVGARLVSGSLAGDWRPAAWAGVALLGTAVATGAVWSGRRARRPGRAQAPTVGLVVDAR